VLSTATAAIADTIAGCPTVKAAVSALQAAGHAPLASGDVVILGGGVIARLHPGVRWDIWAPGQRGVVEVPAG
jgi:hypothetical protein